MPTSNRMDCENDANGRQGDGDGGGSPKHAKGAPAEGKGEKGPCFVWIQTGFMHNEKSDHNETFYNLTHTDHHITCKQYLTADNVYFV